MPPLLRSRLAAIAMIGIFLIPVGFSTLRGLTHTLACEEQSDTPFTLTLRERQRPILTTSTRLARGEERGVCGGLLLDLRARAKSSERVDMVIYITNTSSSFWHGSVRLSTGAISIPVSIGAIAPKATGQDVVGLLLKPGSHEIGGSLLVGP
ncbi:MAG: hypothetical protein ACRDJ4_13425 [Actinomycetota bacterium]